MNDSDWLKSKGWRLIGTQNGKYGKVKFWDHPVHQPDRRGAFTTADAVTHQKASAKYGCNCIK